MAHTFEDVMGTLHGLLNVIGEIRHDQETGQAKIADYDHLKELLSQHTEMIKSLQD